MLERIPVTEKDIAALYKAIQPDTHKGRQGHALIIAGSYGKMGAASLAVKACLHSGAGLVTSFVPECGYTILQTSVPEAMVLTDKKGKYITEIEFDFSPSAIGIGPGLGQDSDTQKAFNRFLRNNKVPLVVDADALNILALNKAWLSFLPPGSILTPHRKEFERLVGSWKSEDEMMILARELSSNFNIAIVLKGSPTHIISKRCIYENPTGNAALATGGSGDVLTGLLTGLMAQGYNANDAAVLGVFLHGRTADIALPETGYQGFTASSVIDYLGKAFLSVDHSIKK